MTLRGWRKRSRGAAAATGMLLSLSVSAAAQTRTVSGQLGVLGEWAFSATVAEQTKGNGRWVESLNLTHIGFCSASGPEEMSGELVLLISEPSQDLTATMVIEGDVCTFSGTLKDGYDGVMACRNRPSVPMMLSIQ